jgi:hypothetical protein
MAAAFIEHRPRASDPNTTTNHFAVVVDGIDVQVWSTQAEAETWARKHGYHPIHVARLRHRQDRDKPEHWRHYS